MGMGDPRIPNVAVHGQRVIDCQEAVPVDRLDSLVQFLGGGGVCFQDRIQDPDGSAQPEVGPVKNYRVACEMDAAAASFDATGSQAGQLLGQNRLDAAGAGGEIA